MRFFPPSPGSKTLPENPNIWVVATFNRGKFEEIREALEGLPIELRPLWSFPDTPKVVEDGASFRENALKKAREVCGATKLPTLADDSGLEVLALGGRPGIYSARYAGDEATEEENLEKILQEMEGVPEGKRDARYVCVLVLCLPEGRQFVIEESCKGRIGMRPVGSGGFGYDPIFFLPEIGGTMAEVPTERKNRISHRGKALARLRQVIVQEKLV